MAHEYGESQPHIFSEPQRGWAHVPTNDQDRSVSPISAVSTPATAHDETQSHGMPVPHQPESVAASNRKGMSEPYEQEIIDPNERQRRRGFFQDWWQEIGSAILSILGIVALIIILAEVNGRRLSDWSIPVSVNAVVSILSTAVKVGMILPVTECISQLKWIHLQSNKSQWDPWHEDGA